MKLLTEVEPETRVVVKKIEGGSEVKASLGDLGIEEGVELTLLASEPVHAHVGPISLKVADKEVIVSQGWADKIFVEKEGAILPLLRLEKGDKGVVKSIEAGGGFKDWVSELGINEGSEVEFLAHIPDEILVLKVDDKEIKMGPGKMSSVWVEAEGKIMQTNYLEGGKKARVSKVLGGTRHEQEMEKVGIRKGREITLVGREVAETPQRRGNYVLAKVGGQMISIGRGMAEKIVVE
jgi:Fe2+ transport system protein FeoA